ncbi:hypothetical protein [Pseudoalteromonas phage J2-1_QLiu-2017]|nr:hypothetical protein [Pseudoalteromonas phage J2-1_QLiu-2017]
MLKFADIPIFVEKFHILLSDPKHKGYRLGQHFINEYVTPEHRILLEQAEVGEMPIDGGKISDLPDLYTALWEEKDTFKAQLLIMDAVLLLDDTEASGDVLGGYLDEELEDNRTY